MKDGGLPKKISTELVQGIQSALSGLTPIKVKPNDLLDASSATEVLPAPSINSANDSTSSSTT